MTGLQPALSALLSLKGPKKQCKKKTSAFDVELTNTNKKALKQYRAGRVLLFRPCNPPFCGQFGGSLEHRWCFTSVVWAQKSREGK